ncbi:MAG TPA: chromosome segregation protein SMC [Syntrophothermus lipocalidus]|nr:chromosome segregation protein SMC [Syntrophothermus lipocalidus]
MYLKRLELKGFKSFAERTEIEFIPGINVIVGPNGCGKSNIVDAIRWALGESNVRHLRGQRNDDVIFSGTDKRRPLGLAQVDVAIDNYDRVLPLDFAEVNVTRKVHRSGESEFYINRVPARLKDVQDLFAGTGLGKKGYSIIGQGELEQILNLKPFDRRLLLEEASGLIKYRHRMEEAETKLTVIKEDMARVEKMLSDLEGRLEVLAEKASKSRRYRELAGELRELEKNLLASAIERLYRELQDYLGERDKVKAELAKTRTLVQQKEQELALLKAKTAELKETLAFYNEERHRLQSELQNCEAEIRLSAERLMNARQRREDLAGEEANYQGLLAKLEENIRLGEDKLAKEEAELKAKVESLREVESRVGQLENVLADFNRDYEDLRTELIEKLKEETEHKNQLTVLQERLKRLEDRLERCQEDLRQKEARVEELEQAESRTREKLNDARVRLDHWQRKKTDTEKAHDRALTSAKEREQALARVQAELYKAEQELNLYYEEERDGRSYPEAVRAVMRAGRDKQYGLDGILGVVGDLIEVPPGLETAVETALGRSVQDIVVRSDKDARRAIEFLKEKKLGRATFLPLDLLRVSDLPRDKIRRAEKMPGVVGWGYELVDYPAGFEKVVKYLLGRVLVVETLQSAVKVYRESGLPVKLVTLEGEVLTYTGAITGGTGGNRSVQHFRRKNWARQQALVLAEKQKECELLLAHLENLRSTASELERGLQDIRQQEEELKLEEKMLMLELENACGERERLIQAIDDLRYENKGYSAEIDSLRESMKDVEAQYQAAADQARRLSDRVEEIKQGHEEMLREYEVLKERTKSYREFVTGKKHEIESLNQNLVQLRKIRESYLKALDKCAQEKKALAVEMDRQESLQLELKTRCDGYQEKQGQLRGEMENLVRAITGLEEDSRGIEKKLTEERQCCKQLEEQSRVVELRIARREADMENQIKLWVDSYGEEYVPGSGIILDGEKEREARQKKEVLTKQLAELEPVDHGAEAEYEEIRARYDFLNNQYQDITEAKNAIYALLKETRAALSSQFAEFLKGVSQSFHQTFLAMFGGGSAFLNSNGAIEDLDSGVEIAVKMPGKRKQLLELLSGGERALTCIAFVFALLVLRPSPFCLLDEIDAALDDVNLARFAGFLKKLSQDIQFIVITHRQGTIEIGQALYGITMPEEGVSRVLSVTMEEAEALAG